MDKEKNGIPKLRFTEFTGAWEQRKLGEVADIFDGTHQTPKYTDSGIKFVSVENIATLETEKYISQKAYESEYSNKQAEKGDVLMTRIGNIGTPKLIEKDEPLAYYVTLALLKPKNIDSNFLTWGISSPKVQRNIWKLTLHIAFPKKINLGEINQVSISIPSINEQKKIGDFFKQLDSLIALHQRKLDHLKKQKTGLLQKMFPKKGEVVPEVRFPGFTDAWEQRKLGEVVNFLDTLRKPLEGAKRVKGPYPYYGASGIVDYVDGYLFDEELILLSEDGANITERNYPVCFLASGKYWVNNHAHVLKIKEDNDNNFICNSLERKDYTKYNTGMAMPKLNKETCKGIPIMCPNYDEQKKIGNYFRKFDTLIALHQRKLDHLQLLKKGLLQQMFV